MAFLRYSGRNGDSGDRRRVILETAKRMFLENGFEQVGMRQIAQAAGVSPALIYKEGWSKADLLAELIFELNASQIETLKAMPLPTLGSLLDRTVFVLKQLYKLDIAHKKLRKLGAAYGWLWNQEQDQRCLQQVNGLTEPVRQLLTEAGLEPVEPRVSGIWCVYWSYFRAAVIYDQDADGCIALIKPILEVLLNASK